MAAMIVKLNSHYCAATTQRARPVVMTTDSHVLLLEFPVTLVVASIGPDLDLPECAIMRGGGCPMSFTSRRDEARPRGTRQVDSQRLSTSGGHRSSSGQRRSSSGHHLFGIATPQRHPMLNVVIGR